MPDKPLFAFATLLSLSAFACGSDDGSVADPTFAEDTPARRPTKTSATPSAAAEHPTASAGADAGSAADAAVTPPKPEAPACKLDTRAVYTQNGRKLESITAHGQYWSRELTGDSFIEGVSYPHAVTAEPKYANGPCGGRADCTLDSRVIWFDGPTKIESTTAYGNSFSWTFDANGGPVSQAGFPQAISATPAFRDGPCTYAGGAACAFDTRTLEATSAGRIETVTAYGRWFEYVVSPSLARTPVVVGQALDSIPRLAAGACKGQPAGACVLDTRTIYTDLDGARMEEVTARGRLWAYRLDAAGAVVATVTGGMPLVDIPRLAGPCSQ